MPSDWRKDNMGGDVPSYDLLGIAMRVCEAIDKHIAISLEDTTQGPRLLEALNDFCCRHESDLLGSPQMVCGWEHVHRAAHALLERRQSRQAQE